MPQRASIFRSAHKRAARTATPSRAKQRKTKSAHPRNCAHRRGPKMPAEVYAGLGSKPQPSKEEPPEAYPCRHHRTAGSATTPTPGAATTRRVRRRGPAHNSPAIAHIRVPARVSRPIATKRSNTKAKGLPPDQPCKYSRWGKPGKGCSITGRAAAVCRPPQAVQTIYAAPHPGGRQARVCAPHQLSPQPGRKVYESCNEGPLPEPTLPAADRSLVGGQDGATGDAMRRRGTGGDGFLHQGGEERKQSILDSSAIHSECSAKRQAPQRVSGPWWK